MDLKDCVKFANENPVCYVATAEGDQPRVRAFMMFFADETGFYFGTLSPKGVSKQLKSNPKVEICFFRPGELQDMKMMRVTGKIEFLDDIALKTRILEERPFLRSLGIEKPEDPRIEVFRICTGEAHFWTLADNLKEPELERLQF
jgi:pyridoxamine 5'-phosphate oxidase